ncbi:metal ABC transporter solute-binding protein, Zn/Mn family [Mesobacillus jeotgali]|uniref:metal ABC transporter solute-binding protein, Zn/Mn family n=1 Tax=Mesobacillus jeotgali TaxID=129985 RepID=UPI0009A67188|nr:zinc ABC transporter substrate-binding protein [Mesobacillus jeotgali]
MKSKNPLLVLFLITATALSGCSSSKESSHEESTETEKLTVYTTISPLKDFAEKIGGEHVAVNTIYPPNVDAHSYEPTTKDMIKLAESDLFFYTGTGVEGFTEKAEQALKNEKVTIVKALENIELIESGHIHSHEEEEGHSKDEHHGNEDSHSEEDLHNKNEAAHSGEDKHHENEAAHSGEDKHHENEAPHSEEDLHNKDEAAHSDEKHHEDEVHIDEEQYEDETHSGKEDHGGQGNYDPHVWLDPILSIKIASNIKDSFVKLMPEHAKDFEKNFLQVEKELKELDREFKKVIDQADKKHVLVAHEAYGYWATRYGIIQIAVNGLSPTQEPSQKELSSLIEEAKEHNLKHIAFEQNVSSRVAEIIQKEIGAEPVTLYNLESISEEDLNNNEDYFSLMQKNLQTLKKVLK